MKGVSKNSNRAVPRYFLSRCVIASLILGIFSALQNAQAEPMDVTLRFIQVTAHTQQERSEIANLGVSIEAVRSDCVWAFAHTKEIQRLQDKGFQVLSNLDPATARGGHQTLFGFPPSDSQFHTYEELMDALNELAQKNPDIARVVSLGKTIENRDIWALHLNSNPQALASGLSNKAGVVFMGNHHAREHLSLEVPLKLAQYIVDHRRFPKVSDLLDTRDIWIIPMVNPDGASFDIEGDSYAHWRKNRRHNGDGTFGVDLNRNYGYGWGTGGSDTDPDSEVYMGSAPFSEPETQAIRDFVDSHRNLKVMLSFHTFSELILYPWGNRNEPITHAEDRATFEVMAKKMATWNHYTPEQSSALYIASGDTTDWAYGVHSIFAFTFELSPRSMWDGGFYPGEKTIDWVFKANLQPCLYLLEVADDPHQVLKNHPTDFLTHYVQPQPSI